MPHPETRIAAATIAAVAESLDHDATIDQRAGAAMAHIIGADVWERVSDRVEGGATLADALIAEHRCAACGAHASTHLVAFVGRVRSCDARCGR